MVNTGESDTLPGEGVIYYGTQKLLRTKDRGVTFEEISGDLTKNEKDKQGLNGGPDFRFGEAVSFVIECGDQAEVDRLWERITLIPEVGGAVFDHGVLRGRFALTGVAVLAMSALSHRARLGAQALGVWLVWLLPIWFATFAVSDLELEHHLRSRVPRLLIHATGIAWAFVASALPLRDAGEKTAASA